MLLSPPGGLRFPLGRSQDGSFPSAKILLPVISFSFAVLRCFSAEAGGASPLKMSLPERSLNFLPVIFFAVFGALSMLASPNEKVLAC